jgi:hypothetical protein
MTESVPEQIEEFVEQTDEDIDHIVVPAEDWDAVNEYENTTVEGEGMKKDTLIGGVPIRWSNRAQSETEAVIPITEDSDE